MNSATRAVWLAGMLVLVADGWAQQSAPPPDQATQLRNLRQQVAALRKQLAGQNAARQELQTQLSALRAQAADLNGLRQQVEALRAEVRSFKANTVLDLNGYLTFEVTNGFPTALFRGINVQIVNGTGDTQTANGMGNLIVGYNRPATGSFVCSAAAVDSEGECAAKGGVWAQTHKSGSHNIVGGDFNNYASWGGIVLGLENSLSAPYAAVIGGARNRAGASFAAISGGSHNTASGIYSSVSAGFANQAAGDFASVSGGGQRLAPGPYDWAGGGASQDR